MSRWYPYDPTVEAFVQRKSLPADLIKKSDERRFPRDVPSKIKLLKEYLDEDIIEEQKINIQEAIRLYEEGLLTIPHYGFVTIQGGKIIDFQAVRLGEPYWTEVFPFLSRPLVSIS
jgi:hypothetical protein